MRPPSSRLRAKAINEKHREVVALGRTAKEIAAEIGDALQAEEKKRKDFEAWCESDALDFSHKMATKYMKVATIRVNHGSLFEEADSIRELIAHKEKKPPKPDTRAAIHPHTSSK